MTALTRLGAVRRLQNAIPRVDALEEYDPLLKHRQRLVHTVWSPVVRGDSLIKAPNRLPQFLFRRKPRDDGLFRERPHFQRRSWSRIPVNGGSGREALLG